MLDSTRLIGSSPQRPRNAWSPALFDQLTDILAEMVLEDFKQFPRLHASQHIDSFTAPGNTSKPTRTGGR